jgi:hypothetical protein
MSGPLPGNLPPSARVGLSGPDARISGRLAALRPEDQAQLARHALMHALLPLALEGERARRSFSARITTAIVPDATPFTRQVVSKLAPPTSRHARGSQRTRTQSRRFSARHQAKRPASGRFGPYALAALVAASVVVAFVWRGGDAPAGAPQPPTADTAVAVLASSESATWEVQPGTLVPGARLRLTRGLVELDLRGKGRLVLDGPADLELVGAGGAILRAGRLVLSITPAGHGYQVETPEGTFIDLGTRFGVIVGADGTSEAHVMEGSVVARPKDGTTEVVLKQDKAARLHSGRLEHIPADPGTFYTRLPPHPAKAADHIHWNLDDGAGLTARAEVRGFPSANAHLTLKAVTGSSPPKWIAGHRGSALAFDGRGGYAESGFPGIAGTQPRTVTCWIRMPRDFTPADGFAIVSWGDPLTPGRGEVWQISLNPLISDGPLGRIRVGTHGGRLVGTTDLRDDRWHHIAVVMYGGAQPDIGTHVMVYVDGRLETISRRTLQTIDTRIVDDGHGVWVGRNVTHQQDNRNSPHGFLRGAVDDLVIAAGALTQDEIRALMDGR